METPSEVEFVNESSSLDRGLLLFHFDARMIPLRLTNKTTDVVAHHTRCQHALIIDDSYKQTFISRSAFKRPAWQAFMWSSVALPRSRRK